MIVTYVTRPARRSIANDAKTVPRTTSVNARAKDAEARSVLSHPGCAPSPGGGRHGTCFVISPRSIAAVCSAGPSPT